MATNAIIATITVAPNATTVTKAMVNSTQWRVGTSGAWNSGNCTLTSDNVYQFRTPLSGMTSGTVATLPNIKADVVINWDETEDIIMSVGDYFMRYYARECSNLTSLGVPDTSGIKSVGDLFMYNYAYRCASLASLKAPDTSGITSVGSDFMRSYANGCTSLTLLGVPDTSGIKSVGDLFMGNYAQSCASLTSLKAPDTSGFTSVGKSFLYNYAAGCVSLTSLGVPDTSGLTSAGIDFMLNYASGCNALEKYILPENTGWFIPRNVNWSVPAGRLGVLKGIAPTPQAVADWQALTVSGKTLYTNYIRNAADILLAEQPATNFPIGTFIDDEFKRASKIGTFVDGVWKEGKAAYTFQGGVRKEIFSNQ
jgi:hypothetical protein